MAMRMNFPRLPFYVRFLKDKSFQKFVVEKVEWNSFWIPKTLTGLQKQGSFIFKIKAKNHEVLHRVWVSMFNPDDNPVSVLWSTVDKDGKGCTCWVDSREMLICWSGMEISNGRKI